MGSRLRDLGPGESFTAVIPAEALERARRVAAHWRAGIAEVLPLPGEQLQLRITRP